MSPNPNVLTTFVTINGQLLVCNDAFANCLGHSPQQLIGKNVDEIFSTKEAAQLLTLLEACKAAPAQSYSVDMDRSIGRKHQRIRWVSYIERKEKDIAGVHFLGHILKQQKTQPEKPIFQSALLEALEDAAFVIDAAGGLQGFNTAAKTLFSIGSKAVHQPLHHAMVKEYVAGIKQLTEQADYNEKPQKFTFSYPTKTGSYIQLQTSVSAIKNEDKLTGFIIIAKEVTTVVSPQQVIQNLFQVFEHSDEAFFFCDTELKLIYLNNSGLEGLKKASNVNPVVGAPILQFVSAERKEHFVGMMKKVLSGEEISYELQTQNGAWLTCKYFPSRSSEGYINGLYGVIKNTTSKKEAGRLAEENSAIVKNLLQSRALFEQFMENSPLVSWLTDEEGIMQYMNPIFQKIYGFTNADLGKSIYDLFDPQLAVDYYMNNQKVLKSGRPVETVEKGITADGEAQVLKIYKFPLLINNQRMVGGWAFNISDQVELQDKLMKSVERHEYVNQATSEAIYDWDFATGKLYKSCRFEEQFGNVEKETSLRHRMKQIHCDDVANFRTVIFDSIRNPKVDKWELEYRLRDFNGEYKIVLDRACIIRNEKKVVRIIGALQDVTAQKALQQKVLNQEKKAKQEVVKSIIETQEKERRELSVELHDNVNQMLASCKLMLEVARENTINSPMLIEKTYQSIQTIINEIRRISHDLNPSAIVDMGLVEAIDQMVEKINLSGKIQVSFSSDRKAYKNLLSEEDKVAIYRIIQEQLNNILKHAKAEKVAIRLQANNGIVKLFIKDNGVGFDAAKCRKGLGLRNIFNRVEYYGGNIHIESSAGKGCEMTIMMRMTKGMVAGLAPVKIA